jgi:flagellin-like protein
MEKGVELNYKKLRRFRKNIKAISPVLSTLLMIAVAVAASLVTYAWVMGYLNFTTTKVGKALEIQSIAYSGTTLSVYAQNVGNGALKFTTTTTIYVNGTAVTSNPLPKPSIGDGETNTWTVTVPTGVTSVTVKVVADDGTFASATQAFG